MRARIADDRPEDWATARRWLQELQSRAEADKRLGDWITVTLLLAQLDAKEQQLVDGLACLNEALRVAEPADYMRTILDEAVIRDEPNTHLAALQSYGSAW